MKPYYGKNSWVHNGRVKSQKQFYALDNKVLKLYIEAGDTGNEYVMFYFLADDSIELTVYNMPNRCKDIRSTYLKRRKVPLDFTVDLPGLQKDSKIITVIANITISITITNTNIIILYILMLLLYIRNPGSNLYLLNLTLLVLFSF